MKKPTLTYYYTVLSILILLSACDKPETASTPTEVIPLSPADLKITGYTDAQVDLSWIDKSTNEKGFKVQRKTETGIFSDIGTTSADVSTFKDTTAKQLTTYTYRVYAFNSAGKSLSYTNEATVTTQKTISLPTINFYYNYPLWNVCQCFCKTIATGRRSAY
ncbi:MAG: hypothetical protein ACK5AO_04515 [bacterium]|jgi:hypothetical protein